MTETHVKGSIMYVPRMDAILNRWFTTYEEARASLESEGGYLLPFRNQFFVTTSEGIRKLGPTPKTPIGRVLGGTGCDPSDKTAWERLNEKRALAI